MRRPPQLKAVVTLYSTDDRYLDDCHYMGGCLLASDMLKWASTMLAFSSRPPDPLVVGDRWRETWLERLDLTPPFIEAWLSHQTRDAYWRHGSIAEDYAAVTCPVLAVGGWADAYTNAVPRLLSWLGGPRRGVIGPWGHVFPERGVPGPAIGFLQECVRRLDRECSLEREGWRTRIVTSSRMTADAEHFHVENTLRAWEGDEPVFERTWHRSVPRDGV